MRSTVLRGIGEGRQAYCSRHLSKFFGRVEDATFGTGMERRNVLVERAAVHKMLSAKVASKARDGAVRLAVVIESRDKGVCLVAHLALIRPPVGPVAVHVALQRLLVEEAPAADAARRLRLDQGRLAAVDERDERLAACVVSTWNFERGTSWKGPPRCQTPPLHGALQKDVGGARASPWDNFRLPTTRQKSLYLFTGV